MEHAAGAVAWLVAKLHVAFPHGGDKGDSRSVARVVDRVPVSRCICALGRTDHLVLQSHPHHNHHNHHKQSHARVIFCVTFLVSMASGQTMSDAQRRKERRLRLWWRHEQQSIAMAWQLRRTTARSSAALHGARSLPPGPRRRWSPNRTTLPGTGDSTSGRAAGTSV